MTIVPPKGPKDAKIVFVGEAPGTEDIKLLEPFVGSGGKLLTDLMAGAGIVRSSCYLTNVIKEHPTGNNIKLFVDLEKSPKITSAYTMYVELLQKELEALKPNVVVAVGNVALFALTGEKAITKWRGSVLPCTLVPGLKVVPIIHPAAALRTYLQIHMISHDLTIVKRESEFPDIRYPEYDLLLNPSFEIAMDTLACLQYKPWLSFDIEVVCGALDCFALAWSDRESVCIALYDSAGPRYTLPQEMMILRKLGEILEDPKIAIWTQNGTFDATFMYERYGIMTNNIEDTMIAAGLITPDFPKSLAFISTIYTTQPYYKDDGKMYYKNPSGDKSGFWRYNCLDTLVVAQALPAMKESMEINKLTETYNYTCAIIPVLIKMQARGIKMDTAGMKQAQIDTAEQIVVMQTLLDKMCGQPINVASSKQVQTYFYIKKGITPYRKNNKPTVDESALAKIAAKGHPEATVMLEIRGLRKLMGTYLEMDLDDDGRMRCSFNPIGTTTGRLSSSKTIFGKGGNMQNQPPIMKTFMMIDEGYVGYAPDLAGAENRIVANVGPVPIMKQAFDSGKDVHRLTASLLSRAICGRFYAPDEVSDEPGQTNIANGRFSLRYWGKRTNHAANYGIGPNQLADKLEINVATAKIILNAYHNGYPEVQHAYQAQIINMLRVNRRVYNCFGRSRLFLDRWDNSLFQDAFAFLPQSTVAEIINRRGLLVLQDYENVDMLNQLHDAVYFQIPLSCSWDYHAKVLNELGAALSAPLTWKIREFFIPADFVMQRKHMGEKLHITLPVTADALASLYNS